VASVILALEKLQLTFKFEVPKSVVMKIAPYVKEELVYFLDATSKNDVLRHLVNSSSKVKEISNSDVFYTAIIEREKIVSTGIGMGVAIPHAKLSFFGEFFLVIAILQQGVEWNALDGAPVRLAFLIGGPDNKQAEYLQILSSLTTAIRDENLRKELMQASSADEVVKLFEGL